jgi:hypothetical protein
VEGKWRHYPTFRLRHLPLAVWLDGLFPLRGRSQPRLDLPLPCGFLAHDSFSSGSSQDRVHSPSLGEQEPGATSYEATVAQSIDLNQKRKIWGGNRTWSDAWAQAMLMSVWRTCLDLPP